MITVYEVKPGTPSIVPRKVEEIKGQRVYFIKNGKRQFEMTKTSWSAIFPTREEAKLYCIAEVCIKIAKTKKILQYQQELLEKCKNL